MHHATSSVLFNLIHALSTGEKRYFKLYVNSRSLHVQNKNYLRLFTAIEKQKAYNETKIIKLGIVKENHLPMLKNYLCNLILESLRSLNSKSDEISNRLQNLLDNARIFFDKNIEEEGMVFLKRAKTLAIKHERFGIALDALLIEMEENIKKGDSKKFESAETEIGILLQKLNNLCEYFRLRREVTSITRKTMIKRNSQNKMLDQLLANPLLNDEHKAMSAYAKNIYYVTLTHYYVFKGDFKTAYKIISNQMHFVESNYSTLNNVERIHSSLLSNLNTILFNLKKYKEAFETIKKHRLLAKNFGKAKELAFFLSMTNEMDLHINAGNFEESVPLVKEIEKDFDKIKNKILDTSILVFYFNSALVYFGVCDYRLAQQRIVKIINHPKITMREDTQAIAHLLQIIIHYELRTPDIIDYLITSTHRFLINRKQLYKTEASFLQFIRNLVNVDSSPKETVTAFRNYRKELVKILKNPKEQVLLRSFDLIAWIDSKIENRPFAEVVRKKAGVNG